MFFRVSLLATTLAASTFATQAFAVEQLEEVVVTASRTEQPISEVIGSVTVITRDEIEQRQAQSLQELLRGELGIDISNAGGLGKQTSLYMRGANSSQTLFLVDGVRLGSASTGITSFELIPVDQIERIEIVRGPRSSLYGSDAIGGVIQIFTRKKDGFSGSLSAGSYDTQNINAGFGIQNKNFKFNINANYMQSGGFDSLGSYNTYPNAPDDWSPVLVKEIERDGYDNSSVSAKFGYTSGRLVDLEFSVLNSQGLSKSDGKYSNELKFRNSTPNIKAVVTPNENLYLSLATGITKDISENLKDNVYESHLNTEKRTTATQIEWRTSQHQFTLGYDYLRDILDSNKSFSVTSRINKGTYAQYLGKINGYALSASLRSDNNEQFGTHRTGNIGIKRELIPELLAINTGWGQGFHAPSFNDLYWTKTPDDGYVGNPALKPEETNNFEIGAMGKYNWITWSIQSYMTTANNLLSYTSTYPEYTKENTSHARIQGIETSIEGNWANLNAKINYTLQDARNLEEGTNYNHFLQRRSRESGRINISYTLKEALLSTNINFVGPRFDDPDNTIRMGGYTTIDLLAHIPLTSTPGLSLEAKAGNILNREYTTTTLYSSDFPYKQEGRSVYLTLRYQPQK